MKKNRTALVAAPPSSPPAVVLRDRVIKRLVEAERALAQAAQVDQVKLVLDVAAAQEIFARRQKLGDDVIGYAHEIKTYALARLGELLKQMEKQGGGRGRKGGGRNWGSRKEPQLGAPPTLGEVLNLKPAAAKKIAHVAQQLAALDGETRDAIAKREKTLAAARREQKAASIRQTASLPNARFRVLYADPPWSYNDKADEGAIQSGGAELHYPSMTIAQLCEMPIPSICEEHAVLFLWVTSPLLFESAAVIKAWGFTYKASFVWDKVKHNMGHYNSVRHEFLLVCTRGSCTPDARTLHDSVQSIERTTHSTKPDAFRQIIDALYPIGKGLELFGRKPAPVGSRWTVYGNQVGERVA